MGTAIWAGTDTALLAMGRLASTWYIEAGATVRTRRAGLRADLRKAKEHKSRKCEETCETAAAVEEAAQQERSQSEAESS